MWETLWMTIWLFTGSIMDVKSRRVPLWLLVTGGIFSLGVSVFQCMEGGREYVDMIRGMLPGIGLLIVAFITKQAGYGDGIVLICLGLLLGGGKSLLLTGLSLFFGSVFSMILLVFRKVGRNPKIPYLPFLAGAWMIVILMEEI